jgi:hypothetical protein
VVTSSTRSGIAIPVHHERLQMATLGVASVVLLAVTGWTSRSLYFVWEEWGHLWDAVESPLWGLLQSHFGYVSPLGRLLFLLEAKVFGDWYSGYVLVNATLMIAVVFLMWRTLRPSNPWASWALVGGLIVFLLSAGSLFAVHFAAMDAYFLTWLFGILALHVWRKSLSPGLVLLFLLLAALSSTLMNVVVAAFVMPAMVALGRPGIEPQWSWSRIRGPVGYAAFSAATSFVLYLLGRNFPSVDPLVGVEQTLAASSGTSVREQLLPLAALLGVWLVVPFIGILALNQDLYQRAVILLIDMPAVAVVCLIIVIAVIALVFSIRTGGRGWRQSSLALLLLTSAVGFAVQLVLFRGNQGFEVRYTLMWLPSIIVFWAWWIELAQPTVLRLLSRAAAVAMLVSALVVTILAPFLVDQAVDLIRPRTELSLELKEAVSRCGETTEPDVADILAPGMPWNAVCDSAEFLRR